MSSSRFSRLLGSARERLQSFGSPSDAGADDGRRQFFRRSAAAGAAAVGAGLMLPGVARATDLDIPPGAVVDAAGNVIRRTPLQSDPFLAQITMFAGTFAPRGWAFCNGQLLPISQYSALFSLMGTTYGGDGRTTFALPDLRGRSPIHPGNGPGLQPISLGQRGGAENVTLTVAQMPMHDHPHTHQQPVSTAAGATSNPSNRVPAVNAGQNNYIGNATDGAFFDPTTSSTTNAGGNQSFNIRDPFLAIYYIIALQGVFPSRS